jgi:hypothetical protein
MEYDIRPGNGAGPVGFGMRPDQVASVLGPPDETGYNSQGEVQEYRGELAVRYDDAFGVVELAFGPALDVTLQGRQLFADGDPVSVLLAADPRPVECLGFLVFLSLGVTITGYHDGDVDQRALTVFRPGRWDALSEHFEPFGDDGEAGC